MAVRGAVDAAASGGVVTSVTGTANQITTSPTTGAVVASIPSDFRLPGTINLLTLTQPATGATLTLADTSSLITVGAFASTFTFTGTTGVTFPTSGTLATTTNLASYLPLAGGTMTGGVGFSVTNTLDVGTSATVLAPRTVYAGTSFVGPIGRFTTSVAIGGATIGTDALAWTGTATGSGFLRVGGVGIGVAADAGNLINIETSANAARVINLYNASAAAASSVRLTLTNDNSNGSLFVRMNGTGFTTAYPNVQAGASIVSGSAASGGLTIATGGAFPISFGYNNAEQARFSGTGIFQVGVAGTLLGSINLSGNTSGTVSILPQAAAGTYNFNLPTTAGTAGQVLTSGGGSGAAMTWTGGDGVSAPTFSAQAASSQAISSATLTKITLGTENFDTNANFASDRFTPTVAGYYQINGIMSGEDTVAITTAYVSIYRNGAEYIRGTAATVTSGANIVQTVGAVIFFNGSSDYVELHGFIAGTSPTFKTFSAIATSFFSGSYLHA